MAYQFSSLLLECHLHETRVLPSVSSWLGPLSPGWRGHSSVCWVVGRGQQGREENTGSKHKDKWDCIRHKSIYSKGNLQQSEKATYSGRKYLQILSGEGRRSKRTRNFYPSIAKIPNNWITKWAKDPNKRFSEGIQTADSFMERRISPTISATSRRANADQKHEDRSPIPVRVATISRCWGGERRTGPLVRCWRECRSVTVPQERS